MMCLFFLLKRDSKHVYEIAPQNQSDIRFKETVHFEPVFNLGLVAPTIPKTRGYGALRCCLSLNWSLFVGMPEEDQGRWQKFLTESLADMNEKNSRELGGHNPMHFSSDDDTDAEYSNHIPFGSNSAQQVNLDFFCISMK